MTAAHPSDEELREFIVSHFDLEELRTLCQDLGVDFDSLRGEGKEAKARELIAYLHRRSRIGYLLAVFERLRPEAWQASFSLREAGESARGKRAASPGRVGGLVKRLVALWGRLLQALRDPLWQGVAALVAILTCVGSMAMWVRPNCWSRWFPTDATQVPAPHRTATSLPTNTPVPAVITVPSTMTATPRTTIPTSPSTPTPTLTETATPTSVPTSDPTSTPLAGSARVIGLDRSVMVYIPGGDFVMGSTKREIEQYAKDASLEGYIAERVGATDSGADHEKAGVARTVPNGCGGIHTSVALPKGSDVRSQVTKCSSECATWGVCHVYAPG
ncbi:MAG: hypothetical protein ACUVX8_18925 [Candidatus Zipacnadales bacterium]